MVLSLLALLARASKPVIRRLGRDPRTDSYLDVALHPDVELVPGLLVVRLDGPLFFADADRFRETLKELIGGADGPVTMVVVDADAISQTDTDGADIIALLAGELRSQGITLALARVQPAILELWTRAGAIDALGPDRVFDTVREAAQAVKAMPAATAGEQTP